MKEREYVVSEGKALEVELQSCLGSNGYGWCITEMPKEVVLMGTSNVSAPEIGPAIVNQKFWFGAVSSETINVEIKFALACLFDLSKVATTFTAKVRIIPKDSTDFVSFSENAANAAMPYGYVCGTQEAALKYGYPCVEATKDTRPYAFVNRK